MTATERTTEARLNKITERVGCCHHWQAFNISKDTLTLYSAIHGSSWCTSLSRYLELHDKTIG